MSPGDDEPTSTDRGVLDRPAPPPDQVLRLGDAEHQVIDLYLPAGPAAPAWVVLVHGGFWRAEWDRTHLRPLATALRARGYAVALVEYARTGTAGGGWPGTFDDVAAALAAVRDHAATDRPAPVVLVGHSAGGHLAAWVLHQPAAAPARGRPDVVGAVSLGGCLDLAMVADLGLDDGAAVDLLGGSPAEVPGRYDAADPARLGRTPYPLVVVHGTADEKVPPAVARSWWRSAGTPGRDRLVLLDGVGHFPLIDPDAPAFAALTSQIGWLLDAR